MLSGNVKLKTNINRGNASNYGRIPHDNKERVVVRKQGFFSPPIFGTCLFYAWLNNIQFHNDHSPNINKYFD